MLKLTNRFHVAVDLFSNRSQMTSKCGKNKEVAHHRQPKRTMFGFGLQRSFWSEYTRINLLSDAK